MTPRSSASLQTHAIPILEWGDGAFLASHSVTNETDFSYYFYVLGTVQVVLRTLGHIVRQLTV